jgi:hypothetical protein
MHVAFGKRLLGTERKRIAATINSPLPKKSSNVPKSLARITAKEKIGGMKKNHTMSVLNTEAASAGPKPQIVAAKMIEM